MYIRVYTITDTTHNRNINNIYILLPDYSITGKLNVNNIQAYKTHAIINTVILDRTN